MEITPSTEDYAGSTDFVTRKYLSQNQAIPRNIYCMTDEHLMQAYVNGDEDAFSQLFRRHRSKVYTYVMRRVKSDSAAEEILQEIFLKFHTSRRTYKKEFLVAQWLYMITKSVLVDYMRRKGRNLQVVASEDLIQAAAAPEVVSQQLDLAGVTGIEEKVLRMRFEEDRDFGDIAKVLNKTEANIRKILSRGIQTLRQKIGSDK